MPAGLPEPSIECAATTWTRSVLGLAVEALAVAAGEGACPLVAAPAPALVPDGEPQAIRERVAASEAATTNADPFVCVLICRHRSGGVPGRADGLAHVADLVDLADLADLAILENLAGLLILGGADL